MGEQVTITDYPGAVDVFNTKKVARVFRKDIPCNCDDIVIQFEDDTKISIPVSFEEITGLYLDIDGREYIPL
jgi:hypothetical protein